VTADLNIRYQQNLRQRKIAIVVLSQLRWSLVRRHLMAIAEAVHTAQTGSFVEVEIPNNR
jgi:hypothetical protein